MVGNAQYACLSVLCSVAHIMDMIAQASLSMGAKLCVMQAVPSVQVLTAVPSWVELQ